MRAIGIDYGTTTSWIAVQGAKEITLASLKSACCILKDGQKEFGQRAYNSRANGTFIRSPKTSIAKRSWKDFRDKYSYELNDIIEEFSQKLIVEGCRNFGNNENVLHVTVTIPNCYDGAQMKYMRDCFEKVLSERFPNRFKLHLLPEPIAAALYYVLGENQAMMDGYVLVCDMGGGTTDLALIKFYKDNSSVKFEVVATTADATLGGDALDEELFNRAQRDWRVADRPLADPNAARQKITEAKEMLSTRESCRVSVDATGGVQRICFVSSNNIRQCWENTEKDLGRRFFDCMSRLKASVEMNLPNFNWADTIILPVGGSMKIPALRGRLQGFFGGQLFNMRHADKGESYDSVVLGAMLYSAIHSGSISGISNVEVVGRTLFPISIETINGRLTPIVGANMPDGDYENNQLRPLKIEDDGTFKIDQLKFYYSDAHTIANLEAPFTLHIDGLFQANGRSSDEIKIQVMLTIKESQPTKARVIIANIDSKGNSKGNNYDKTFELTQIWENN